MEEIDKTLDNILFNTVLRCPSCGGKAIRAYYSELISGICDIIDYEEGCGFEFDNYDNTDGEGFEVYSFECLDCQFCSEDENEFIGAPIMKKVKK